MPERRPNDCKVLVLHRKFAIESTISESFDVLTRTCCYWRNQKKICTHKCNSLGNINLWIVLLRMCQTNRTFFFIASMSFTSICQQLSIHDERKISAWGNKPNKSEWLACVSIIFSCKIVQFSAMWEVWSKWKIEIECVECVLRCQ